ncbi:Eukaryotic translation initiation factor 3 subunit G-2 [Cucumispora dikerogammari]|nr:Eukaryotic translation initiation factor 3 subunit G-2 [Cucumispora dikerogammari]
MDITQTKYKHTPVPEISFGLKQKDPSFTCHILCDVKFTNYKSTVSQKAKQSLNNKEFSMSFIEASTVKKIDSGLFTFDQEKVTLKFTNIPFNFTSNDLLNRIKIIKTPFDCFIVMKDKVSLGFAYVHFFSMKDALEVKKAFNGKPMDRSIVDVSLVTSRS